MIGTNTNSTRAETGRTGADSQPCELAVIWIDWYAYHVARFRGLHESVALNGRVIGIEIVGGVGVHRGLKFREEIPSSLPVETLFPGESWDDVKGWKGVRAVWRCLSRLNPKNVLVPGYYTLPGIAAALWCKWHGRRSLLMTESTEGDHKRRGLVERGKSLLIRGLFDCAVTGGRPQRDYLEKLGFPPTRIGGSYDVVDNDFFARETALIRRRHSAAEFGLTEDYFLYVGRLSAEKNIAALLSAYTEYRRAGGDRSLVLVGDGPERRSLEAYALESGFAADIRFEGLRGTSELPRYYAFAGCFVLPSTREPWGLVTNEAMAAALPVLVSSRCGCAEDLVIEGENGLLFDPSQPGSLLASLCVMGSLDRERLQEMGSQSRRMIEHFSPETWAAEVARLLDLRRESGVSR
jgi:1,2-diacylglycerol 3-alpha-glucosyltransferase